MEESLVKAPNDKGGKSNDDAFKTKMKLVIEEQAKEDFKANLISQIQEFRSHVDRSSTQYKQMKLLKDGLEDNELIVQMDFAENYSCQSLNEIQSAYWNQTTVTLHPTVIYYKQGQELKRKSLIFVSDEERHNAWGKLVFYAMPLIFTISHAVTLKKYRAVTFCLICMLKAHNKENHELQARR